MMDGPRSTTRYEQGCTSRVPTPDECNEKWSTRTISCQVRRIMCIRIHKKNAQSKGRTRGLQIHRDGARKVCGVFVLYARRPMSGPQGMSSSLHVSCRLPVVSPRGGHKCGGVQDVHVHEERHGGKVGVHT